MKLKKFPQTSPLALRGKRLTLIEKIGITD
jgi:hypothetical protein